MRWGTDWGAIASMIVGIVVNIVWRFGVRFQFESMKEVHEVFPAFLLSVVTYLVISRLTPNRKPDEEHLNLVFGKK